MSNSFESKAPGDVVKVGPWGSLELVEVVIAPPTQFMPESMVDEFMFVWNLDSETEDQLLVVLEGAGVSATMCESLMVNAQRDANGGLQLRPSHQWVRDLPDETRVLLYTAFASHYPRSPQANSLRYCGASVDEWLGDANLQASSVEAVRPYVFRRGAFLLFADLPLAMAGIGDREERVRLAKALSREVTMLVKIQIHPNSDIDELETYWGVGRRNKDLRPILESLTRFRDGQLIDIVHMLPPFARRLLYTYPQPPKSPEDSARDCHWTSLNFFNEIPDDRYLELAHVVRAVEQEYYLLHENPRFGDLVLFSDYGGEVFHTAIYIAEDIVFTKNGPTITRPWMFMNLLTMRDFYPRQLPTQVRFFRRREFAN